MHWLLDPITKHYVDFSGRTPRQAYWMFTLFIMLLYVALMIVSVTLFGPTTGLVFIFIAALVLLLPSLSIQVRRLHDIGKSGWWLLLSFIPYVGGLILLVMYCLPSQAGSNKYGSHPYGVASTATEANTTPTAVAQTDSTDTTH
jgi:uncharacterized membrane protein YhaH (DUF805 family)